MAGTFLESQSSASLGCDPVTEAYKRDIDRTLLRENLKLTVHERFVQFERVMIQLEELRNAGRRLRQSRRNGAPQP